MTQGRDRISLAQAVAFKFKGVARPLSVATALFAIAALLAGTAGTSYAKSKKKQSPASTSLQDSVVVTNYGALFGGNLETFAEGSRRAAGPEFYVHGTNTTLSASTGPGGVAQSSRDAHIAVAVPLDFLDFTGCGPFPGGTGLVDIFGPTSTGNSAPESIICNPGVVAGAPNTTGIFVPQGTAFESPFDGINPGRDILAVSNSYLEVVFPDSGEAACADGGAALGTITMYDIENDLVPGYNVELEPFENNPVLAINPFTGAGPFVQNATIGGCLSLLAGPVGLTFDDFGLLYVVNNAGELAPPFAAAPRYVTVYDIPDEGYGDLFPIAVLGLPGTDTEGDLIQPEFITVLSGEFLEAGADAKSDEIPAFDDVVFVTDSGDNSIKIFAPFENFNGEFFEGALLGTIKGGATKLKSPMGIALGFDGDVLYVVNNFANTLAMYTDIDSDIDGGGDLSPTLLVQGRGTKLNLPVGLAVPVFSPTATCTPDSGTENGFAPCTPIPTETETIIPTERGAL